MRTSFVGKNILDTIDKHIRKRIAITISTKGKLYDRISGESFDAKRANEIWTTLYELAKEGKLGGFGAIGNLINLNKPKNYNGH